MNADASADVVDATGLSSRLGLRVPIHAPLLAAWVVLLLYSENAAEVRPSEVVVPLLQFVLVAAGCVSVLRLVLKDWQRAAFVTTTVLLPLVAFGHIRRVVPESLVGEDRILALMCVVASLMLIALVDRKRLILPAVNRGLDAVSIVLMVMVVGSIVLFHASEVRSSTSSPTPSDVQAHVGDESLAAAGDRDIFHIVLDQYGSTDALQRLGIDNSAFTGWLAARGFDVCGGARANYARSILSLSATLDMRLLGDHAALIGRDSRSLQPLEDLIKHNPAAARLQGAGYEYIHLGSWWPATESSSIADRTYSAGVSRDFVTALWSTTALPAFTDLLTFPQRHAEAAEFQFEMLNRLAEARGDRPRYVFAHVLMPHAPFVMLGDGTYALGEASYASQLAYVNDRLRVFVEQVLQRPEIEQPIVILQADEGPPITRASKDGAFDWDSATADELAIRFGVLNAMYFPGLEDESPLPRAMTLVNTYPEVFRRYYGTEPARRPDRQFTSPTGRPYEFTDVTQRIAKLEPEE